MTTRPSAAALVGTVLLLAGAETAKAQDAVQDAAQEAPALPEVRQLVTFQFQPGKTGEALSIFKEQALPLYEANEAMLFFRGFLEMESPEPLDLIVVKRKEIIVAPLRPLSVR